MAHAKNLGKKIVDGTYGRLEFDFATHRGKSFNEHHLHGVLNEVLTSNVDLQGASVEPNYAAPALQRSETKSGDKKKLDFAVIEQLDEDWRELAVVRSNNILCAIEAKWAKSAYCTDTSILNDLCRLSLVATANPGSICYFVLAGPKRDLIRLFRSPLLSPPERGASGPLPLTKEAYDDLRAEELASVANSSKLKLANHSTEGKAFQLRSTGDKVAAIPIKLQVELSEKLPSLPAAIRATFVRPAHEITPNWKVFAWRIHGE